MDKNAVKLILLSALPCWFKLAVINGPAKKLLTQIGAKKRRGKDGSMFFSLIYFFAPFPYFTFRIIMSFRKPCHMPFRKLIPPFTLTVSKGGGKQLPPTKTIKRNKLGIDSQASGRGGGGKC